MDATSRKTERAAGLGDPQAQRQVAVDALRRGDRLAACLTLAAIVCGQLAAELEAKGAPSARHLRYVASVVIVRVRDELCDLLPPPPVGAWRRCRDLSGPVRQPRLTPAEDYAVYRAACAWSQA